MTDAVTATIDALAVYRITRLIVSDTLFDEPRRALLERLDASESPVAGKMAEGLDCPWCVSVWVGGGVLAFKASAPRAWRALSFVLATSAVAGILSGHEFQPDEFTVHDDLPEEPDA